MFFFLYEEATYFIQGYICLSGLFCAREFLLKSNLVLFYVFRLPVRVRGSDATGNCCVTETKCYISV